MPTSSIDGQTIEFNLDKYDAANVYNIQDTNIEVNVIITKKDGSLPLATAKVGPINNLLHSMWQSIRLTINDTPITGHKFKGCLKTEYLYKISYDNKICLGLGSLVFNEFIKHPLHFSLARKLSIQKLHFKLFDLFKFGESCTVVNTWMV
jgi:hypothetical protein